MTRIDLFVIDGQNDFCASGAQPDDDAGHRGALFVEGADVEAENVAKLIARLGRKLTKIHATLDNHHRNDGSHNVSWQGSDGSEPPPFTLVHPADVEAGTWVPRFRFGMWNGQQIASREWALQYTTGLEKNGRAPLCLWPIHCQIGTWGSNIYQPLLDAQNQWCAATAGWVNYITKGQWIWTEHYSGLQADVPDPTRPETQMNTTVVKDAMKADHILWTGWAGSHCLRYTALDAINHFGPASNDFVKKSIFFTDASAAVTDIPGAPVKFSQWRINFLEEMQSRGARLMTTEQFMK